MLSLDALQWLQLAPSTEIDRNQPGARAFCAVLYPIRSTVRCQQAIWANRLQASGSIVC